MWYLILGSVGLVSVVAVLYVTFRIHRFSYVKRLAQAHRLLAWVVSFLPVAAVGLFALINIPTMLIVLLHLFLGWVICDIVAALIRKVSKKRFGYDAQNCAAILLTVIYLGIGWFLAHHVFVTPYALHTDKAIGGDLRVVEIADAHLGITLDGDGFARLMERVQQTRPDVVALVGDFVDDDTPKRDMLVACRALGGLDTTYGVFFVFGNHDEGFFHYRDFTSAELRRALSDNGMIVLEDESMLIDDRFYIVGRRDRSAYGRADASALTDGLDCSKYIVMLDHQPNDYAEEAESGADLVLSGHTHGGHIFPAGWIGLATGANDREYGIQERNGTTFVVTSGVSGWAIPFKTGAVSEFVVIDIVA